MQRSTLSLAAFLVVFSLACSSFVSGQTARKPGRALQRPTFLPASGAKYVPDHVLVRFRPGTAKYVTESAHMTVGAQVLRSYSVVEGLELVRLAPGVSVDEGMRLYRQFPDVLYAEPDYVRHADVTPNDPQWPSLWGMTSIHAPQAWDLSTGSNSVVVGVIDTGADYNHPDLTANIYNNTVECSGAPNTDNDGNGYKNDCHGINAITNSGDPMDDNEHGTHVSGTIGAVGNNSVGVVGVNWRVKILPCKFLDAGGSGSDSDAIKCLDYFAWMHDHGVNIVAINASWGGYGADQALSDAIAAQAGRGILFFAAAGNGGADGIGDNNDLLPHYPSSYFLPNLVSVAAIDSANSLADFSNFGRRSVYLGAPGVGILSTLPGNNYASFNGTSMATPHVTGVAALLAGQYPMWDWKVIKNRILAGGTGTGALLGKSVTERRLDAYGAMICTNPAVITAWLQPRSSTATVEAGSSLLLAALNVGCSGPAGNVLINVSPGGGVLTLHDDGLNGDQFAGDGIYTGRWTAPGVGTYTLSLSGGSSITVTVTPAALTYTVAPVVYGWRDSCQTSNALTSLDDDSVVQVTPGFQVNFGGVGYNSFWVSSNGTISFNQAFSGFNPSGIPTSATSTLVAPFWDDLHPIAGDTAHTVYWQTRGMRYHQEVVVAWCGVPHYGYGSTSENVTFQVIMFEDTSDVLFEYQDTTFGGSTSRYDAGDMASVGLQTSSTAGARWSFQTPSLSAGLALRFTLPGPASAPTLSSISPSVLPPGSAAFQLTAIGSNFVPNSVVRWKGGDRTTYYDNSTQLRAEIPASDVAQLGSASVTVFNPAPGGGESAPRTFTIVVPENYTAVATPSAVGMSRPATETVSVTVTAIGAFIDTVHLACRTPLPTGVSCAYSQNDFVPSTSGTSVTLTLATTTATPLGPLVVHVDVTGSSPAVPTRFLDINVNVLAGLRFVAVTPCRVADTRTPNGPFGGPFISGGTSRGFTVPNSSCNIPGTAQAYAVNLTVVPRGPLGYLTAYPCGQSPPLASNLNAIDGRVKAVAAIVPAGTSGGLCAYASDNTDLVVDINGYFVPNTDPTALAFYPMTPCRLVDTRLPNAPLAGPSLVAGATRTFPVRSSSCNLTGYLATAVAYSLNFTSVPKGFLAYLTTWPAGQTQPLVSTLNAPTGTVTANAAIVPAGTNGALNVFATNDSDLVIDINGYFAPPGALPGGVGGLSLYNVAPCRVLDTRNPSGSQPFNGEIDVNVRTSSCGVSSSARAFVMNATVVPANGLGFLTLWPQGVQQPLASTLNAIDSAVTSNLAIVPTSNGSHCAYASNPTHLVLDAFGYFAY